MAIVASELKLFRSQNVSASAATNGGRISSNEIISSVANNLFPDVPQAERLAGSTVLRKFFFKNNNLGNLPLYNSKVFIENFTQGDDAVYMIVGDHFGVESGLTGSEKVYGAGKLDVSASIGATTLQVLIEDPAVQFFKAGDTIRISNRTAIDSVGNEEFRTIVGNPGYAGSVATIVINSALAFAYDAAATRVANVYAHGDLAGAASNVAAATVGDGVYNNTDNPIVIPNLSGVYDDWTVTFTSGTTYGVVGAREGSVGSGSTLSDFAPNNPSFALPYFTLKAAGFSGAWASGDTLSFRTSPAAVPLWGKRIIPANAGAVAGNRVIFGITGETA